MIKTRNGLFANQGWGGGVFNGNVAFGSVDSSPSSVLGMGSLPPNFNIPSSCFDRPAFQQCYAVAKNEAVLQCDYCRDNPGDTDNCGGFTTHSNCVDRVANASAKVNCVPSFCQSHDPDPIKNLKFVPYQRGEPCGSPNTIKNVQFMVGTDSDGIWGPLSQNAYDTTKRVQGTTWCDMVPGCTGMGPLGFGCAGATAPQSTPQPSDLEPEKEVETGEKKGSGVLFLAVGGLVALLAATVYFGKDSK